MLVPSALPAGTLLLMRRPADFWRVAACYVGAAVGALAWILPRHATQGFSFSKIGWAVQPLFINHVIYATVLALLLPLAGGARGPGPHAGQRRWWLVAGACCCLG